MSLHYVFTTVLASLILGSTSLFAASADPVGPPPTTKVFQIVKLDSDEIPGYLTLGEKRDLFVGFPLLNQIRRYSHYGELLKTYPFPIDSGSSVEGLVTKWNGDVYALVNTFNSMDKSANGVWKLTTEGLSKFASIKAEGSLADLVFDKCDNLYISDSYFGVIWKVNRQGEVVLWKAHALLQGDPIGPFIPYTPIGAVGVAMGKKNHHLFVGNMDYGRIVKIKIHHDGSAGEASVFVEDSRLVGVAGLSFNRRGFLYAAVPNRHTIVSISHHGNIEEIFEGAPLEFPFDIAMKRQKGINAGFLTNKATSIQEDQGIYRIKVANDPFHTDD